MFKPHATHNPPENRKLLKQMSFVSSKIDKMEEAMMNINFFVGGLTDEAIEYYYNKMVNEGKISFP